MSEQTEEQMPRETRGESQENSQGERRASRAESPIAPSQAAESKALSSKAPSSSVLSHEHAEKLFGDLAPLARVLSHATSVLDEETQLVAGRSSLNELRNVAQKKEALLTQHDLQILRLKGKAENLSVFASSLDQGVRKRLRALYGRFEEALRHNGLRLKAALASSEMLLAALSDAAQADSPKGPQLYTPQGRLSETDSVSLSLSPVSQSEV